jgi:hypothetical protein
VPSHIRERLKSPEFGGTGSDFDLIVKGRGVIGGRCGIWLREAAACKQGGDAVRAAQKCLDKAKVDGSIWEALNAYDAAAAARRAIQRCDPAVVGPKPPDLGPGPCQPYDPKAPRSEWNRENVRRCQLIQGQVDSFDCEKRREKPYESGAHRAAVMQALQSARDHLKKCREYTSGHLAAAAGEAFCKAHGAYMHAMHLCQWVDPRKEKCGPGYLKDGDFCVKACPPGQKRELGECRVPCPPGQRRTWRGKCERVPGEDEDADLCAQAVAYIEKQGCDAGFQKEIAPHLEKALSLALPAWAAQCGTGITKGFVCSIPNTITGTAEAFCGAFKACRDDSIGKRLCQVGGVVGPLLSPAGLAPCIGYCVGKWLKPKLQQAYVCLRSLPWSALARVGGEHVCELAGDLAMGAAITALSGGAAGAGVAASKLQKVFRVIKKVAEALNPAEYQKLVEAVKKMNGACGTKLALEERPDAPADATAFADARTTRPTARVPRRERRRRKAKRRASRPRGPVRLALRASPDRPRPASASGEPGHVTASDVSFRREPATTGAVIRYLARCQTLRILAAAGPRYTKVEVDARVGYVATQYTKRGGCR